MSNIKYESEKKKFENVPVLLIFNFNFLGMKDVVERKVTEDNLESEQQLQKYTKMMMAMMNTMMSIPNRVFHTMKSHRYGI